MAEDKIDLKYEFWYKRYRCTSLGKFRRAALSWSVPFVKSARLASPRSKCTMYTKIQVVVNKKREVL